MRIRHVMTKDPSCCVPEDTAVKAASIMRQEKAGIVPVIDNEQSRRVVGVVTDRDLCMNVIAESRDPNSVAVKQCMTTSVVTCSPNDSIDRAMQLMKENQIRRIPVIDESGTLQGIVAIGDLVSRATPKVTQTHETLKCVSMPTDAASKPREQSRRAA
jgi:CBS domain-containing protein